MLRLTLPNDLPGDRREQAKQKVSLPAARFGVENTSLWVNLGREEQAFCGGSVALCFVN